MSMSEVRARQIRERVLNNEHIEDVAKRLLPRLPADEPLPPRIPLGNDFSRQGLERRQSFMREQGMAIDNIAGDCDLPDPESLRGNIENLIGFASMPIGVIGPLRVNGLYANGDFYVPLATTEGAMVASYHRGAYLISQSGGAVAMCLSESVLRAPCFSFSSVQESALFLSWVVTQTDKFQEIVSQTSRHCKYMDMNISINGKELYLIFEYTTGDASGQNMVTVATEAVCKYLVENGPIRPVDWLLEGNLSGDKKATMLAFSTTRGKKVVVEVIVPRRLVLRILHADPEAIAHAAAVSLRGGIQSGSIGAQGHYANALASIFIACGQDAACVSEASVGLTTMDVTPEGDLYVSASLPSLIVGTVGGGTHLPVARECLQMLGCAGTGNARKFAEICAVTAMAGEISIMGAMAAGDFGSAHAKYRHKLKKKSEDE